MTSSKKAWLSAIAVFAIAFSLFFIGSAFMQKNSESASIAGEKWYVLTEGQNPDLASSYSLVGDGSHPASCSDGQDEICSIFAMPSSNPNEPDLDTIDESKTILRASTP